MQVPAAFPNVFVSIKGMGFPNDCPVSVEMSPLTLCKDGDSFCQTTVAPVGIDTLLGV